MHVGSAGNADGGCFHSRFQSPFYVQSQVFRPHCERFSKILYSERRKYFEMFGIITQIQTILNLGTIPNFRNHCDTFGTIPRFRNFFKHGRP